MTDVIQGYKGLSWREVPGTIISRNTKRYGWAYGAIVLVPAFVQKEDLPRYAKGEGGQLSYDYPNPIIHVQGLPEEMTDAQIVWEFSKMGPIKGYSRAKEERNCVWIEYFKGRDARDAIIRMHGMFIRDEDIEVENADRALKQSAGAVYGEEIFRLEGFETVETQIDMDFQRGMF